MMALAADAETRLASILDIFRGGTGETPMSDAESEAIVANAEASAASTTAFAVKPDDHGHEFDITYQPATRATGGPAPGTQALQNRILQEFGGTNGGIYNNRNVRGGTSLSLHAEGRAGDVMVRDVGLGNRIRDWLVANARSLGVQEVIFNRQRWTASTGWRPYRGQNPHVDHVHYSMTREAAGQVGNFATVSHGPTPAGTKQPVATIDRLGSMLDIIRGGDPNRQTFSTGSTPAGAPATASVGGGGSTAQMATSGQKAALQQYARSMLGQYGWGDDQMPALVELVQRESSWNPNAQNPRSTAYGLFQFLNATWGDYGPKTNDPKLQIKYGLAYIKRRYGDVNAALAFHRRNGWY